MITPLETAFAALDDVVRGMLGVVSRRGTEGRGRSGTVRASVDCYHATQCVVGVVGICERSYGKRAIGWGFVGGTRTGNEGCSRRNIWVDCETLNLSLPME